MHESVADPGFPRQGGANLSFSKIFAENCIKTSMHSSRMRTARLLAVSPSMNCALGVPASGPWGGGSASGPGVCSRGGGGGGGGDLLLGGVPASGPGRGESAPGGGCLPLVLGGVSQHAMGQAPPPHPYPVNRILDTRF